MGALLHYITHLAMDPHSASQAGPPPASTVRAAIDADAAARRPLDEEVARLLAAAAPLQSLHTFAIEASTSLREWAARLLEQSAGASA